MTTESNRASLWTARCNCCVHNPTTTSPDSVTAAPSSQLCAFSEVASQCITNTGNSCLKEDTRVSDEDVKQIVPHAFLDYTSNCFVFQGGRGVMDVKHELIYRVGGGGDIGESAIVNSIMKAGLGGLGPSASGICLTDDLLLSSVKTEPRVHSPCDPSAGTTAATLELGHHHLASSATATSGVAPSSSGGAATPNGGLFSGISASKRPRADDWLPSPSSGSAGHLPPLTPSPGPPGHPYTVISNGYSSPLSSGSYEPYSPNGKIGKYRSILALFRWGISDSLTGIVCELVCVGCWKWVLWRCRFRLSPCRRISSPKLLNRFWRNLVSGFALILLGQYRLRSNIDLNNHCGKGVSNLDVFIFFYSLDVYVWHHMCQGRRFGLRPLYDWVVGIPR
jgi:hypothetical protein